MPIDHKCSRSSIENDVVDSRGRVCNPKASVGSWRRERDLNPRSAFRRSHAFQACAFNHSAISPLGSRIVGGALHNVNPSKTKCEDRRRIHYVPIYHGLCFASGPVPALYLNIVNRFFPVPEGGQEGILSQSHRGRVIYLNRVGLFSREYESAGSLTALAVACTASVGHLNLRRNDTWETHWN